MVTPVTLTMLYAFALSSHSLESSCIDTGLVVSSFHDCGTSALHVLLTQTSSANSRIISITQWLLSNVAYAAQMVVGRSVGLSRIRNLSLGLALRGTSLGSTRLDGG